MASDKGVAETQHKPDLFPPQETLNSTLKNTLMCVKGLILLLLATK